MIYVYYVKLDIYFVNVASRAIKSPKMNHKNISSVQNPTVKRLLLLQSKAKARRREDGFVVEGLRELGLCYSGGYQIKEIYYVAHLIDFKDIQHVLPNAQDIEFVQITEEVYKKLAYRDTTEGVIAFAKAKTTRLQNLVLPKNPLIMVAEAPEKPGNIGALLRTADAANVDAFIIANPKTDLYNPNIIRSSVGCVFTNQVAMRRHQLEAEISSALSDGVITNDEREKIDDLRQRLNITEEDAMAIIGYLQRKNDQK